MHQKVEPRDGKKRCGLVQLRYRNDVDTGINGGRDVAEQSPPRCRYSLCPLG